MFKNYQELFVSYAEFYTNRIYSDQSIFASLSDGLVNAAATASNKVLASTYLSTNDTQQEVGSRKEADYTRGTRSYQTGRAQDDIGAPDIGSKMLDEYGNDVVIGSFNSLSLTDSINILTLFISFIIMKRYLSKGISTSTFVASLGLRSKDRERLEECIWRLIFYACSSFWLIYSCFMKRQGQLYLDHNQVIAEYSFTVDPDEYLICMIEVSFYLHATYAILFEDVWRRDSPMMLVHHIAAIFSVASIYATRLGLTVMVLRDTCDVLLEVTKLAMCLRIQHDKVVKSLEKSVKIFLFIFAVAFVVNQLYYYPLFCLYHALNVIKTYQLKSPVITGIVTCSLIFLILDLFWFLLIVRLLYRVICTRAPLEDLREYEDEKTEKECITASDRKKTDYIYKNQ